MGLGKEEKWKAVEGQSSLAFRIRMGGEGNLFWFTDQVVERKKLALL